MFWLLAYDLALIALSWLASWYCFELVPWKVYGIWQSWFFNFCAVLFLVLVLRSWRYNVLGKVCHFLYHGSHLWQKAVPGTRELSVLRHTDEKVRCEFCIRCHRTRISFVRNGEQRRYVADAEDKETTREY